jgi:hypothetical protein
MEFEESPFEFTARWFALGIVTPARLAALRAAWDDSDDRSVEHYRWRTFTEFLAERRPLEAGTAAALYELGERDVDPSMGASMIDTIVRLPECPSEVLAAAAKSGRRHLERLAERRRVKASQDPVQ